MLGGLARWLRAAGYDASWHDGIDDGDLVRLARDEGKVALSSDDDIFAYEYYRDGKRLDQYRCRDRARSKEFS